MATWRDCGGCAKHDGHELETGSTDTLGVFDMHCNSWHDVYVPQNVEASMKNLTDMGGSEVLMRRLQTSMTEGIPGTPEDVKNRVAQFGENKFPEPPFESWFSLFFDCFKDLILIILIVAAIVSIIIESIEKPDKGWIDGVAIMIAVVIVATVTATNDYNKQLQFRALSKESAGMTEVSVIRSGVATAVKVAEVLVGDIIKVDQGMKLPVDGVVLRATDLKTNESALTGESDEVKKTTDVNPFLLAGTNVTSGTGLYVATAVGIKSLQGQILKDTAAEDEDTPLQKKLDLLATRVGYLGMTFAILTFIAMMIIKATGGVAYKTWAEWTIHSFIYAVTIIVVAIPEGLPLAVTISLAFSTGKMLKDKNLIRHLDACETMGNATDICTDKTGTLTKNEMTVVQAWLAQNMYPFAGSALAKGAPVNPATDLPAAVTPLLIEQLSINSTATITRKTDEGGRTLEEVRGSKTEGAGIKLVRTMGSDFVDIRARFDAEHRVIKQFAFSSERKMMSTIVELTDGRVRVYTTGGSDMVLSRCVNVVSVSAAGSELVTSALTDAASESIVRNVIQPMAKASLRTIALSYKEFPNRASVPEEVLETPEQGLTLYGIIGIMDPLRDEVEGAVRTAQAAGVKVRMVTGDNIVTARAIAKQCGIVTKDDDIVMEGPTFRRLTPDQVDMILPRLAVLARSSPKDKMILVRRLNGNLPRTKEEWEEEHSGANWETDRDRLLPGYFEEWKKARSLGRGDPYKAVVGVTGDGTNDAPALKASDVGLSMGIAGTDIAKEASDIIITDDNFASIIKAIKWGRSVFDNVQGFLQFQLTVNVCALLLTFLSAVLQEDPPLNPIMMLWVNLIMDTLGALALATQTPTEALLLRRPYSSSAFIVRPRMWRHIFIQAGFQLILLLVLLKVAEDRFGINLDFLLTSGRYLNAPGLPRTEDVVMYKSTFIFNAFVFCQVFNELNARSLDNDWNVFRGLWRERIFIAVIVASIGMQALIVEVGGDFTRTTGLIGMHWLYTILMGAISLPLGLLMRIVPVCDKPSDFASYYQSMFYEAMEKKLEAAKSEHPAFMAHEPEPVRLDRDAPVGGLPGSSRTLEVPISGPMSPTNELALISGLSDDAGIASPAKLETSAA